MRKLKPYRLSLDFESGNISFYTDKKEIRLSDLEPYFVDTKSVREKMGGKENPIIYTYCDCVQPPTRGEMNFGITDIRPGKIGEEYNFTRGHYHMDRETGEIYIGIRGEGLLLMQKRDGEFRSEKIVKGGVIYAPMDWSGHRTVNTGKDNLVFFTVELAETGHDYKIVRKDGFAKLVVERKGKPRIINNPKYRP